MSLKFDGTIIAGDPIYDTEMQKLITPSANHIMFLKG